MVQVDDETRKKWNRETAVMKSLHNEERRITLAYIVCTAYRALQTAEKDHSKVEYVDKSLRQALVQMFFKCTIDDPTGLINNGFLYVQSGDYPAGAMKALENKDIRYAVAVTLSNVFGELIDARQSPGKVSNIDKALRQILVQELLKAEVSDPTGRIEDDFLRVETHYGRPIPIKRP